MLPVSALPVLLGAILHQIYRLKEPEISSLSITAIALFPLVSTLVRFIVLGQYGGLTVILRDHGICYASWAVSVIIYRLSPLHPLSEFPGPWILRISKLGGVWICSQGRQHEVFRRLHTRYGPIIRVGPNELSVCDLTAVKSVLGSDGLPKGNCR